MWRAWPYLSTSEKIKAGSVQRGPGQGFEFRLAGETNHESRVTSHEWEELCEVGYLEVHFQNQRQVRVIAAKEIFVNEDADTAEEMEEQTLLTNEIQ